MKSAEEGWSVRVLPSILIILVAAFAVYGPSLGHDFIFNWDDNVYVTANEAVRGPSFAHLKAAFSSFYVGNYAPLHIVSYMLDYHLWGLNPKGYHLSNILVHACNACLAFSLYSLLGLRKPLALAAALLFLVHPVQVETVAWISERKTLLAMFFSLLSLHAYLRFNSGSSADNRKWYLLALVSFAAALLCKSVAVILPLFLVAFDWHSCGWHEMKKRLAGKIPFFILSGLFAVVTVASQRSAESLLQYLGDDPVNNAMTIMPVFARYIGLIFWPLHLGPVYKPPIKTAMDIEVLMSLFLLALCLLLTCYLLYRRKTAGLGMFFFFLGLLPVSHIFPIPTLMQDRYLYFPMFGFTLFLASQAGDVAKGCADGKGVRLAVVVLLLLALPLSFVARNQVAVWRNAETLWAHAVEVVPRSKQAWLLLATAQHDQKQFASAEAAYLRLLEIAPKDKGGLSGLGILYGENGNLDKSFEYLQRAVQAAPNDPEMLVNFGYAAYLKGDLDVSKDSFYRAMDLNPALLRKLLPTLTEIAKRQQDRLELDRLDELSGGLVRQR